MAEVNPPVYPTDKVGNDGKGQGIESKSGLAEVDIQSSNDSTSQDGPTSVVPLRMKLISILLVTAVGFGSRWSGGVTGAMKSTLKKVTYYPTKFVLRVRSKC